MKKDQILSSIVERYNISPAEIEGYINTQEELVGCGSGGTESIVIFLKRKKTNDIIVRKIWSQKVIVAKWSANGKSVMAPPLKKAILQTQYLKGLPEEVKPYFPTVYALKIAKKSVGSMKQKHKGEVSLHEIICDQSYVPGIEVSKFIETYRPSSAIVAHLYKEIFRCLKEKVHIHRKKPRKKPTLETSYLSKITDRLTISYKTAPNVLKTLMAGKYIWINGKKYINIPTLVSEFRNSEFSNVLEPKYHSLVMGDTNTENIKITNIAPVLQAMKNNHINFTYDDVGITFIDPRGIGFESGGGSTVDDYMYDNKPLHNSLGNYDLIHGEHFTVICKNEKNGSHVDIRELRGNPFKSSYTNFGKYFKSIMEDGWGVYHPDFLKDDPYWLIRFVFIMGTHFAAMMPFHLRKEADGSVVDDAQVQKRVIAVYCEGVKWLNTAYLMLHGQIKEFYGFTVPEVKQWN